MKVKRLNLLGINRQCFEVWNTFTSVLSQRAGVRSSLFPILYNSKERSWERSNASPGVSNVMNLSIQETSSKKYGIL